MRPNLIDLHIAHARLVEAVGVTAGWLNEAHGADLPGALEETERACDRIIVATQALRAEARRQRYAETNARAAAAPFPPRVPQPDPALLPAGDDWAGMPQAEAECRGIA